MPASEIRRVEPEPTTTAAALDELGPADAAMAALSTELRNELAALDGAPNDAAALAVSIFPYGHRALLETYELIETLSPADAKGEDPLAESRARVRITDLGRAIITACAHPSEVQRSSEELRLRTQEFQNEFRGELQFETAEASS